MSQDALLQKDPIVIIGTGLSGYTLGKEFRKHDQETPLLFLTADLTFSITFSIPSGESLQGKGKSFRFLASLTLVEITEL